MSVANKRTQFLYDNAYSETVENQNLKDLLENCSKRQRGNMKTDGLDKVRAATQKMRMQLNVFEKEHSAKMKAL